ncbi:hypothetical protein [Catalinimonas alkaloidigena]|uniref:hypothetical protein n=1 Tax=Catalinimonas alkaloidigena TaxID=1075417 RepID=UPI0015A27A0B|nr:hypothetical protein [Catalinimonas alkaloidigena]
MTQLHVTMHLIPHFSFEPILVPLTGIFTRPVSTGYQLSLSFTHQLNRYVWFTSIA